VIKRHGRDVHEGDSLHVPDAYGLGSESPAERCESGPLYRCFSNYQLYGTGFAGVALGLARASLDAFMTLATTKTPYSKSGLLRDNAVIQSQVALAEAKLASARSYLLALLRDTWDAALAGEQPTLDRRARIKLAGVYAAHQGKEVIDTVYHAAGASAIFED